MIHVAFESPQIPSYFSDIVTNLHSAFGIPVRGESALEQRRLGLVHLHLFVVVNYDADFPVESATSLSYLFVIFSSIHHFVDYKHYRPTRGTRVSYN